MKGAKGRRVVDGLLSSPAASRVLVCERILG